MSLRHSLRALAQLSRQHPPRRASSDSARVRETCDGPPPPPCAPCPPKKPPPCRCPKPERLRAQRLSCCPPPVGMRPPCAPRLPACALTCDNISPPQLPHPPQAAMPETWSTADVEAAKLACKCDAQIDPVTKRLQASEQMRHADYVAELALKEAPMPEPRPYRLAGERECATALGGDEVTILREEPAAAYAARCGPCREPPPPRCVEIGRDPDGCKFSHGQVVDPCAHKPRLLMSVSRTKPECAPNQQSQPPKCPSPTSSPFSPCAQAHMALATPSSAQLQQASTPDCKKTMFNPSGSPEGITSRIMKALAGTSVAPSACELKSGGSGGGQKCSRKSCGVECESKGGEARFAGDSGWCGSYQPPPTAPRCRPPSAGERMRRRPRCPPFCGPRAAPPATTPSLSPAQRRLHTSVMAAAANASAAPDMAAIVAKSKEDAAKLKAALQERAHFKEAALGRSAVPDECTPCQKPPVAPPSEGSLELPVPEGARLVRVDVSVGHACDALAPMPNTSPLVPSEGSCSGTPPAESTRVVSASPPSSSGQNRCGTLLKTLQKKFSRANAESADEKGKCPKKKCGESPCTSPCSPKVHPCPPKRSNIEREPQTPAASPCAPNKDKPANPKSPCAPCKKNACHKQSSESKKSSCCTTVSTLDILTNTIFVKS